MLNTQISVLSQDSIMKISSLSTWRNFASLAIQNVLTEDSDWTTNMQADLNLDWACMMRNVGERSLYNLWAT